MKNILHIAAITLLALPVVAQPAKGIKPRSNPESYPAVKQQAALTLGAEQLSSTEVRRTFVSSIDKNYVVLEVGAFPKSEVQLSPQDFMLVVRGEKSAIRPADPDTVARKLGKKEQTSHDVSVAPVAGVTYNSGRDPYDPAYPDHGWTTTTGTMVNVGRQQRDPGTLEADRKTMATELKEKQLPAGSTAQPVAGYLYFPASDKKNAQYDLEYRGPAGNVVIPLTPVSE